MGLCKMTGRYDIRPRPTNPQELKKRITEVSRKVAARNSGDRREI